MQFLGMEKATSKALNAETLSTQRKIGGRQVQDPGVEARRRISFKATNLIGSFQDDVVSGWVARFAI